MKLSNKGAAVAAALLLATGGLAACGSSSKSSGGGGGGSKPASLSYSISESGKKASFSGPSTAKGGLTTLTLKNTGKAPHGIQLVEIRGNHTVQDALKVVNAQSEKTPAWVRGQGGIGGIPPGQTAQATLNLPAGKYVVTDAASQGPGGATTPLTLSGGKTGTLPSTPGTITGAKAGEHKYNWQVSGQQLKSGKNDVTFKSQGADAIHLIAMFRVKGKTPSKQEVLKGLESHGKPPSFVDTSSFTQSAVLDGGRSQTTALYIRKPGTYVMFCPLSDREGGKPHFMQGMVKTVTVK